MQLTRTLIVATMLVATRASAQAAPLVKPTQDPYDSSAPPAWQASSTLGTEFGLGTVFPTLHTAAFQLQGRLGVSIRTPGNFALVLAGQSGATIAFNAGNSQSPYYGYLVRIPLEGIIEGIWSHMVSYEHNRFINIHVGMSAGGDLILAAQCQLGNCNYIQPSIAPSLGLRAGISASALRRSGLGVFVTWHNDFATCSEGASNTCANWLSTIIWSIGWMQF